MEFLHNSIFPSLVGLQQQKCVCMFVFKILLLKGFVEDLGNLHIFIWSISSKLHKVKKKLISPRNSFLNSLHHHKSFELIEKLLKSILISYHDKENIYQDTSSFDSSYTKWTKFVQFYIHLKCIEYFYYCRLFWNNK